MRCKRVHIKKHFHFNSNLKLFFFISSNHPNISKHMYTCEKITIFFINFCWVVIHKLKFYRIYLVKAQNDFLMLFTSMSKRLFVYLKKNIDMYQLSMKPQIY